MSASIAAAKKRRAPAQQTAPPAPVPTRNLTPAQPMSSPGLTLPQVIALVDQRLISLETGMRELRTATPREETELPEVPSNLTEVLEEFNSRFESLADEIGNLKNIVLSLQSYTMDVNKMLLEERVRILSEDPKSVFEQSLSASM
jgi:hypothetical protein